jgi:hypothetical protein
MHLLNHLLDLAGGGQLIETQKEKRKAGKG